MTTALYRRYRPDTFDEVIGQDQVTEPLRAALRANRVTHAYLFSGPRGCGKTTSARILARCLNCAQGSTDTPCGHCDSCRELATGGPGSLDVVEMDAASHGGVDDARDLRERASFAPVRDRYKVFIIDEAHMVTPQGFNALLKLVEEPPDHVKFIFATTAPEKVLGTIRSRTHHYPFRLVPPDVLEPYLRHLCDEESITAGPGVLGLVMRAGGGSVRDTLSVLDQLMAGSVDGSLDYHRTVALLGYTDSALLDQSVDALAGGDGAAVYRVVERMVESGHDPRRFVEDLLQRLRDLLIIAVAGDGAADVLSDIPSDQLERMRVQARNWGARGLSRAADLTDQALRSMTGATSPRLQLELLLGRILVPTETPARLDTTASQIPGGTGSVPGGVGMVGGGAPREGATAPGHFGAAEAREQLRRERAARGTGSVPTPEVGQVTAVPTPSTPTTSVLPADEGASEPEPEPSGLSGRDGAHRGAATSGYGAADAHEAPEPTAPNGNKQTTVPEPSHGPGQAHAPAHAAQQPTAPTDDAEPGPAGAGRDADMLRDRWEEVVERLSAISRVTWSMLRNDAQLGGVDAHTVVIVLPSTGHVRNFEGGHRAGDVERAIHEVTGLDLQVHAQVSQASGGEAVTTPSAPAAHPDAHEFDHTAPIIPTREQSVPARPATTETMTDEPAVSAHPASIPARPPSAPTPPTRPEGLTTSGWGPVAIPGGDLDGASRGADASAAAPAVMGPRPVPETEPGSAPFDEPRHAASGHALVKDEDERPGTAAPVFDADTTPTHTSHVPGGALAGWSEPVALPGGLAPSAPAFDDEDDPGEPDEGAGPGRTRRWDSPPEDVEVPAGAPVEEAPGVPAAEDDSASIDDADVDTAPNAGLPAVLEILGGTVIEETADEEAW